MHLLISCESASAPELMRDALRVGRELAVKGHKITYAMADPIAFAEYRDEDTGATVIPAPVLREPPELLMKRKPPSGFDDHLAVSGFANLFHLRTLAGIWRDIIGFLKPDAVIGFDAPVSWLVGAAYAPTIAAGPGQFLPPRLLRGYPRLSASNPPLAADHMMLANANRVLADVQAPPLVQLTDLTGRCVELIYGLPALDPYLQLRSQPNLGSLRPLQGGSPIPRKRRLAFFLDVNSPGIEPLLLGIAAMDEIDVDVFLRGGTAGMLRFLEQAAQVTVWKSHNDLAAHVGDMSGVAHHGEHDIAETCLAAGRPQLLLPWNDEQKLLVENFNWMGLSMKARPGTSVAENAKLIEAFAKNASLAVHAQHHSRQLDAEHRTDAMTAIVTRILASAGTLAPVSAADAASSSKETTGAPASRARALGC